MCCMLHFIYIFSYNFTLHTEQRIFPTIFRQAIPALFTLHIKSHFSYNFQKLMYSLFTQIFLYNFIASFYLLTIYISSIAPCMCVNLNESS